MNILKTSFALIALSAGAVACAGGTAGTGGSKDIALVDPSGDDNGPGSYTYPTDKVYKPGSFDLRELRVTPNGDTVEFEVTLGARIEDPWDSKAWGGNGFSIQMAFIHIDMDHKEGSGELTGLPGTNVRFNPAEAWDRVVVLSPQGPTRLNSEIDQKAPERKAKIVVPKITRAVGKKLKAVVSVADLGGVPSRAWGYQVLMQSNEGFPARTDLLTRKVNEYEGQHRFGGGTDYDNDPHVIDMFAGSAKGAAEEKKAQHDMLGKFNREATEPKADDLAMVPMIYPES
ncbi:MAG: glucodextranase DOMON-like domain-containing protein [Myxococcota bacterium]